MLTDEEIMAIRNKCSHENGVIISMDFAREIERAVLAKATPNETMLDSLLECVKVPGDATAYDKFNALQQHWYATARDDLANAGEQEPIYMWRPEDEGWMECTKAWFDSPMAEGYEKRIVYAHPAQAIPEGYTAIKTDVFKWLLGENGDFECPKSQYFRDKPARYFWRTNLRNSVLSASPKP